jgi:hypothetical protein
MHKRKTVVAIGLLVAAGAIGVAATTGFAHEPGKMRIQNKSKFFMTYTVPSDDNWYNCNDAPVSGFAVAAVRFEHDRPGAGAWLALATSAGLFIASRSLLRGLSRYGETLESVISVLV